MSDDDVCCTVTLAPCACTATWSQEHVDFLADTYPRLYVRFASACGAWRAECVDEHVERQLAALLAQRAPRVFRAASARLRYRERVARAEQGDAAAINEALESYGSVAAVCARAAAADTLIGLAGVRLPYIVASLIASFATGYSDHFLQPYVRDRIAILLLKSVQQ